MVAPDGTVSGTSECAENEFPVNSIREGEVFGIHTIRYDSEADSISITHDAKNRKGLPWELFWRRNIHPGMKDY